MQPRLRKRLTIAVWFVCIGGPWLYMGFCFLRDQHRRSVLPTLMGATPQQVIRAFGRPDSESIEGKSWTYHGGLGPILPPRNIYVSFGPTDTVVSTHVASDSFD